MTYVGIDNGVSGAVAILRPVALPGSAEVLKVPTRGVGADTRIDAVRLYDLLLALTHPDERGHAREPLGIVFEQGQKQPKFGVKGNFANGRSHGVVETIVELLNVKAGALYRPVNPKDWQGDVFTGIRKWDMDTKAAAKEFCRRTYPSVSLLPTLRCRVEDDNIADALCMAWWAKHKAF